MDLTALQFRPVQNGFPEQRLFVFSGRGSVQWLPGTVLGIGAFFFPPLSGRDFRLLYRLKLPSLQAEIGDAPACEHYAPPQIMLQDMVWDPWRITRTGIFHRWIANQRVLLEVNSELVVPADADGIVMRVDLCLRSPRTLAIQIEQQMENSARAFGACVDSAWNYEPPAATGIVWSEGSKRWRVDGYSLELLAEGAMRENDQGWSLKLMQNRPQTIYLGVRFVGKGLEPISPHLRRHAESARKYWTSACASASNKFAAELSRMPDAHQRLFERGWITAMTCRWDRPNFITRPFYSSEGIDGGAICSYLWDFSYPTCFLAELEGRELRPLIKRFVDPEQIFSGYSLSPTNGQWLGVFYAFSPYALVKSVFDYVTTTGDVAFLKARTAGTTVLGAIERIVEEFDRRFRKPNLLDFGHNRHLIELHTAGYEGLVPNPNLEHGWSLQAINKLRRLADLPARSRLDARSKQLLRGCEQRFWDERRGWYFPAAGRSGEKIWSIQILSALRLGVIPPAHIQKMCRHLRDTRFLGSHGLHAVSPHDRRHFALHDIDWGGGGCFVGHVAIVIEGLAASGQRDLADAVLERVAWWGTALPYLPQSAARRCTFRISGPPKRTCGGLYLSGVVDPTSPGFNSEKAFPLREKTMNILMTLFSMLLALLLALVATEPATAADPTTQPAQTVHVKITVKVPKDTECKYRVYLSGNLGEVGNGKPDGVLLEELTSAAAYLFDMQLSKGQTLQYKITCGSLDTVEVGTDGKPIEPRVLNLDQDHDEKISVARWLFRPETPKSTVTGQLRLHEEFHSAILNNNRTLRVWLPPNYDKDADTRYAVLYLHDGQSCFDAMTSYSGEFEADEAADQLIRAKKIPPIIMVGIDNNPDRINELTPTVDASFESGPPEQRKLGGGGNGESYAQFIITEVKPFIDQHYRTLPDREHTATAGSSLGGLISLYMGYKHGDVFSRIGAMSTSLGWDKQAMLNEIVNDPTSLKRERLWLDVGTHEGQSDEPRQQHLLTNRHLVDALRQRGMKPGEDYFYLEDPGAVHLPRAWARRFPRVLEFLFAPPK